VYVPILVASDRATVQPPVSGSPTQAHRLRWCREHSYQGWLVSKCSLITVNETQAVDSLGCRLSLSALERRGRLRNHAQVNNSREPRKEGRSCPEGICRDHRPRAEGEGRSELLLSARVDIAFSHCAATVNSMSPDAPCNAKSCPKCGTQMAREA